MMKEIMQKFFSDNLVFASFVVLCVFYLSSIFSDFISPYSQYHSNRSLSYCPASSIYIFDENKKLSLPYTYNYKRFYDEENFKVTYVEDTSKKHYLTFLAKSDEYKFLNLFKTNIHLFGTKDQDGRFFLLGTDINGRDFFSRLMIGSKISLFIGFVAIFISVPLGMLYGGISGYFGGKVDTFMMRFAEAIMSIPSFYLLIILAGVLPSNLSSTQRFLLITSILAFVGWASLARVIRGMVLSVKNNEYVLASEILGQSKFKIIVKHILPQTISFVIVAVSLSIPGYILSESALSFLGLGIQQPDASWGNLLKDAQNYNILVTKPWLLSSGVFIFLTVLSYNIISDKLRDIFDPKS